ncbi:hypothetical protein BH780_gp234 [Bacillus phage Eldridge]|uniref:Uncharacterized protein n=1 Tax=Bacillus phage Eldridge TaxID=1776293 RepID=A0A0Y0AHQ9_9CAUD|nr:hypothetical protein BH780_gp004 [Bacillus phage Eldridge]YP_009274941.1 hypothetical protein BH780_gp234 [Bacillus phage Eldridge]AMB18814.1 hypothetical protein Eldridge_04 [Bacillus phage Eldridge]AMB18815.1 hypothetical protein Eldridge_0237 [Bacillus phage Eldridge]
MRDAYEVLKAFEANGKRLADYKKQNDSMFKKIDRQFKKFFKKFL